LRVNAITAWRFLVYLDELLGLSISLEFLPRCGSRREDFKLVAFLPDHAAGFDFDHFLASVEPMSEDGVQFSLVIQVIWLARPLLLRLL